MAAPHSDPAPDADSDLRGRQAERQRIAQLLHDTVSQSLGGTYLQAMAVLQRLQKNGSEAEGDVSRLVDMIHHVVLELHAVTRQLTPEE